MYSSLHFKWTLQSYQRFCFLPEKQLSVLHEEVLTLPELVFNLQMHCVPKDMSFVWISEGISPQGECYNFKLEYQGCIPPLVPSIDTVEGCSSKLPTCYWLWSLCYRESLFRLIVAQVLHWIWTSPSSMHNILKCTTLGYEVWKETCMRWVFMYQGLPISR